jgi:hypothetical protein
MRRSWVRFPPPAQFTVQTMKGVDMVYLMLRSTYGGVISDRNTLKIKRYNIRYMLDMLKKTEVLRRSLVQLLLGRFLSS